MAQVGCEPRRHGKDPSSHPSVVHLHNRLFQSLEGGAPEGETDQSFEVHQAVRTNHGMMGGNDRGVPLQAKLAELKPDQLEFQNI